MPKPIKDLNINICNKLRVCYHAKKDSFPQEIAESTGDQMSDVINAFNNIVNAYKFSEDFKVADKMISELTDITSGNFLPVVPQVSLDYGVDVRYALNSKRFLNAIIRDDIEVAMDGFSVSQSIKVEDLSFLKVLINDILENDLNQERVKTYFQEQVRIDDLNKSWSSGRYQDKDEENKRPRGFSSQASLGR